MKKLLGLLALLGAVSATGCACTKEGVYKFDSIVITVGEEEKTYSCTAEEKEENVMLAGYCEMMEGIKMELKDDKATITYAVEEGEEAEEGETADYKIEDGKFFVKEADDEEYEEIGTYEKGKITLGFGEAFKVVLEKE